MSTASNTYKREKTARSLDTILVHNPHSIDYVMWNDRHGPSRMKYTVPKAQRDIGFGKGNNQFPRFIAERYSKQQIESEITKASDAAWLEKKKEYRTLDETIQHAERVPMRTNDVQMWKKLLPKYWLGLIEKYGGEALPDPVEPIIPDSGNPMKDAMNDLNLEEKKYEPTTEDN